MKRPRTVFSKSDGGSDDLVVRLRIVLPYIVLGALWILFSDQLLLLFSTSPRLMLLLSTLKGWFYIVITAILLNVLVSHELRKKKSLEKLLREEIAQKEVLLAEIHHRVKNNLQIVSSIVNLERSKAIGEEAREICDGTISRINSMALVHEQLYEEKDFAEIDLDEYLHSLAASINEFYGKIDVEFSYDLDSAKATPEVAIPFGLFLSEAITNAVRHGYIEGSRAAVHLGLRRFDDQKIELRILDEGPGFPPHAESSGLGMNLMRALADQLKGELSFSSVPGALVSLRFPLTNERLPNRTLDKPMKESRL